MSGLVATWDGVCGENWVGIVHTDGTTLFVWDAGEIVELRDYLHAHYIDISNVRVIPSDCLSKWSKGRGF